MVTPTIETSNQQKLFRNFSRIEPDIPQEQIVVLFPFNLTRDSNSCPLDGLVAVCKDKIRIYEKGNKIEEVQLTQIKEIKCVTGIGCVFMEYKCDDKDHLLCRASMTFHIEYAAIAKRLNKYLEDFVFTTDYEEELNRFCPKCGRPYTPGSVLCAHCVNKKSYLKRIFVISKPYWFKIFLSTLFFFAITALRMLPPVINRILVDDFIQSTQTVEWVQFIFVILSLLVVSVVTDGISMGRSLLLISVSSKVIVKLREMVFNKIQLLSISRISKRTSGELMHRVSNDTNQLQHFITYQFADMVEQALIFLAVGTILFVYDWKLALMILLPVPFVLLAVRLFWGFLDRLYDKQWATDSKSNTVLHDIFSGIRVVKAFGMEKKEMERYDGTIEELRDISIRNEKTYAIISPIINFFMGAGEFFLLYYVGSRILNGTMTLGEMAQFSAYVGIIYGPLYWISNMPRRLIQAMTSIVKIFEIVDEKVDVSDKENAIDLKIKGTIAFDHAYFGYDETSDVLKNINLTIQPGEMIGIVGKSGVGKSTLINLVMRLYDVNSGTLKIDGVNIKDISQESLRSQIGVVLQETFLFSGTIYDNIAYAKPDASRDEIITASKIAGAHSFIMKLPDAYNTKVGERGHTLSGGERQRVSIARALLHNPRILILDEATAALDTETERQIQDSLQKLIKDRTTLAIAHRLSTLRNATRLIVLDKGTIAEVGTHEELIKQKGIYYGLVMAQRQMSKMAIVPPKEVS